MKKALLYSLSLLLFALTSCEIPFGQTDPTTPDFTISPATLQMKVGEMAVLETVGVEGAEWVSDNEAVASVFHGAITANAIGKATIMAIKGDKKALCPVFVTGTDGATLRISPATISLQKGESYQFQYGNTYDLPLTWSSSDPSIVSVDSKGLAQALSSGVATITLSTDLEQVSATVTVAREWGAYSLVWSDEFNGSSLDLSVWNIEQGGHGWGNNELQYYTDRRENVRVEDGCLKIEARLEAYDNRNYTSARINSKQKKAFKYGKIESRIKFPGGKGTWPAFWMMGNDFNTVGWPACGEIDIMEHVGSQDSRASFALHTPERNGMNGRNWHGTHFFDYPLSSDYHVYGIEWCEEEENGRDCIRFMVDGVVYATATEETLNDNRSWPFNKEHFIIFNMAIGGNMGGAVDDAIFSSERIMYVDYVRVYQRSQK